MFDTFARLLSSIPTFVFPVFASYKALKTSDPALLTPWLMYWIVLAIALLFESWAGFILYWIPFYSWIRLTFLLYLILPQTQGARVLYQEHVHPFLHNNELAIDDFISSAHDRAKAASVTYLKRAIEYIKQNLLNIPPKELTPPPTPGPYSYAQNLFARFNLPSARPSFPSAPGASTANDFYTLLASAVTAATSSTATSSTSQPRDLSISATLIPPTVQGQDRISFIAAQRERLAILLSALDKEASDLQQTDETAKPNPLQTVIDEEVVDKERPKSTMSGMSSRKSEPDFEKIDADSGTEEYGRRKAAKSASGSWMPWSWGFKAEEKSVDQVMSGMDDNGESRGKSSGVDA